MSIHKTVYLVDDDVAVRTALTRSLTSRGYDVRAYASGEDFLEMLDASNPACLVLDVRMPGLSGLDLQAILVEKYPTLPIIFITGHGDIPMSVRAIKDGAFEFLEKPYRVEVLLRHIDDALVKSEELITEKDNVLEMKSRLDTLTNRELDVMKLLVAGIANSSNKEIARQLNISHRTVDDHRARIMAKMQARSFSELVEISKICGVHQPENETQ